MDKSLIYFENGPEGRPALFAGAAKILQAHHLEEVAPLLAAADAARQKGYWVAGALSYEAGLAFEPRLVPLARPAADEPLAVFGLFPSPRGVRDFAEAFPGAPSAPPRLAPPQPAPGLGQAWHQAAMAEIAALLAAGDTYQINLTFPLESQLLAGDGPGLFAALLAHQPVTDAAYAAFPGAPEVLSLSPELFFATDAGGQITCAPMKGTAPRGGSPAEDAALAEALAASEKNRAENLMITDLLRNDLSRLCHPGSVKVPALFAVQRLASLHQMVSRITGALAAPPALATLFPALFPCGSITGAPKIRAMEIIAGLEPRPRGLYCGSLGWMAPDGRAAFNVAIRTLRLIDGGALRLNVGGGVVADSTAAGEWEEALWKARFLAPFIAQGSA